ncbi:hypothetical protein D5018_21095, partial [Parashewanella curva]
MANLTPSNATPSDNFVSFIGLNEEKGNEESNPVSAFGFTIDEISCKTRDDWHQSVIQTPKANIWKYDLELAKPRVLSITSSPNEIYPETKFNWVLRAEEKKSQTNPQLTLILDLDRTIFVSFVNSSERSTFHEQNTRFKK